MTVRELLRSASARRIMLVVAFIAVLLLLWFRASDMEGMSWGMLGEFQMEISKLPPVGMASVALRIRFRNTCLSWFASPLITSFFASTFT